MSLRWQADQLLNGTARYEEADRIGFKRRPRRRLVRGRCLHKHEPRLDANCANVVVQQLRMGLRERECCGHPPLTEGLVTVKCGVMCKRLSELSAALNPRAWLIALLAGRQDRARS